MAKKKKYYVVWAGQDSGVIYDSWTECQQAVKGVSNARFKSFTSKAEAEAALQDMDGYWGKNRRGTGVKKQKTHDMKGVIWESISVDAACSGNPGRMEYQGVDTKTGYQFFHQKFELGTNNIGEFLALVHGLAWCQQQGNLDMPIYSDSRIAMGWVKAKKCKTTLKRNAKTARLFDLIQRGESWLKQNTYKNPLLKWETEIWGEIPADFGRK